MDSRGSRTRGTAESNRALAIIAPERRDALAVALSEEAAARVDDVLAALEASKSAAAAAATTATTATRSGAAARAARQRRRGSRRRRRRNFPRASRPRLRRFFVWYAPSSRCTNATMTLTPRLSSTPRAALSSRREIAGKTAEGAAAEEARALVRVPPRGALASARMGGVATRLATRDALRRFAERLRAGVDRALGRVGGDGTRRRRVDPSTSTPRTRPTEDTDRRSFDTCSPRSWRRISDSPPPSTTRPRPGPRERGRPATKTNATLDEPARRIGRRDRTRADAAVAAAGSGPRRALPDSRASRRRRLV